MPLAFTVRDEWDDGKRIHVVGTLVASGNYVAGGEVPTTNGRSGIRTKATTKAPVHVDINGKAGYEYEHDRATEKILTRQGDNTNAAAAPLIQIPAAAYPAGVTGDVIDVYAIFPKFG